MTDKIKTCDIVKVKASGKVGVIIEVQYKHDRYHIRGLSNWQYGIDDLEKVEIDSLIATIESQKQEIERLKIAVHIDVSLGNTVAEMHTELESQKDITDLAVKALESISIGYYGAADCKAFSIGILREIKALK